jgi:hypothetical protein
MVTIGATSFSWNRERGNVIRICAEASTAFPLAELPNQFNVRSQKGTDVLMTKKDVHKDGENEIQAWIYVNRHPIKGLDGNWYSMIATIFND